MKHITLIPILAVLTALAGACTTTSQAKDTRQNNLAFAEVDELFDITEGVDTSAWKNKNRAAFSDTGQDESPFK